MVLSVCCLEGIYTGGTLIEGVLCGSDDAISLSPQAAGKDSLISLHDLLQ